MNHEIPSGGYKPSAEALSLPAQLAVGRYLEAMKRLYPGLTDRAMVGPGNEGTVYVYIPFPHDEEENLEIPESMAEVGAQIVADTGVVIVLMPSSP